MRPSIMSKKIEKLLELLDEKHRIMGKPKSKRKNNASHGKVRNGFKEAVKELRKDQNSIGSVERIKNVKERL